jgi:hypothetical protein
MTPQFLWEMLEAQGILILPTGSGLLKAVTNYHVTSEGTDYILKCVSKVTDISERLKSGIANRVFRCQPSAPDTRSQLE